MSKRSSDYQLTQDNFNEDDDEKDSNDASSSNKMATPDVLKQRVILKAKRRNITGDSEENTTNKSAFSGFKGFSSVEKTNSSGFGFNFGSKFATSTTSTFTFGSNNNASNIDSKKDDSGKITSNSTSISSIKESEKPDKETSFITNLKKLNDSFFEHVKKYYDNPKSIYDFTLVCEEYISKCKKLRTESSSESIKEEKTESIKTNHNSDNTNKSLFSFGSGGDNKSSTTTTNNSSTSSSSFLFSNDLFKPPPFVFKSLPIPTTIGQTDNNKIITKNENDAAKVGENDDGAGADHDEQPPKVVSVEHSEEDSVYTKKCKLYYKKEDSFVEKGVGFLYIKLPKNDDDKNDGGEDDGKIKKKRSPQLLIRADTNTGNILLNIALIESLPISKAENNKGVMLTCIPNPPIDKDVNKHVTFLLRVKANDCQQLYENLLKFKK